jgi:hypothetical protein
MKEIVGGYLCEMYGEEGKRSTDHNEMDLATLH